jgi:transcriptional regulator NrdR family protein
MKCPKCKNASEVLETIAKGDRTKRRRRCLNTGCGFRFVSFEAAEGDTGSVTEPVLPEWIERVRNRPGVDKEAIACAYRVDQRRRQIEREAKARARAEREFDYDEEAPLSREELMREIRGY